MADPEIVVVGRPLGPFDVALKEILRHEGGYVNHPRDPGGMTNLGVTRATWERWLGRKCTEAEMRALTVADVAPVYRQNYWDAVRGDDLPPGLALCVFDFAVNAGPGRAARLLQSLVATVVDGQIGPMTVAAVKRWIREFGEPQAIRDYQDLRRSYYRNLSTFKVFGRGWLRRVDDVERAALRLVP